MAQQTINIGASPNDGTGTPLRTSFDYTNQNFTELYTATGPSGNNIVVPGTATITGDLDVSGNGAFIGIGRVGLQRPFIPTGQNGTTTLDYRWYSTGTTYVTGARIRASSEAAWSSVSAPTRLMFETVPSGAVGLSERYRISGDGLHTWSNVNNVGGTQMTLDGTGLIVTGATITGAATVGTTLGVTGVSTFAAGTALLPALTTTGDTNTGIYYPTADNFAVTTGGVERCVVNSAGFYVSTGTTRPLDLTNSAVTTEREIKITNSSVTGFLGVEGTPGRFLGSAANNAYFGTNGAFGLEFATNNNVRMTLNTTGNLAFKDGLGIDFSAVTGGTGTATANVLNDYEEGTWVGTMTGGTTNPTIPVTATGRYTKIGRVVTVQISFSNVNTLGAVGTIGVTGLPFACNNSSSSSNGSVSFYSIATFTGSPFVSIGVNESFLNFFSNISNAAFGNVTHNAGAAGNYLTASITYTV